MKLLIQFIVYVLTTFFYHNSAYAQDCEDLSSGFKNQVFKLFTEDSDPTSNSAYIIKTSVCEKIDVMTYESLTSSEKEVFREHLRTKHNENFINSETGQPYASIEEAIEYSSIISKESVNAEFDKQYIRNESANLIEISNKLTKQYEARFTCHYVAHDEAQKILSKAEKHVNENKSAVAATKAIKTDLDMAITQFHVDIKRCKSKNPIHSTDQNSQTPHDKLEELLSLKSFTIEEELREQLNNAEKGLNELNKEYKKTASLMTSQSLKMGNFLQQMAGKCKDNPLACAAVVGGTVAVGAGIKKYKDDRDEKKEKKKIRRAEEAEEQAAQERIDECKSGVNYTQVACRETLKQACGNADNEFDNGCIAFYHTYCAEKEPQNIGDDPTPGPGAGTQFCENNQARHYCASGGPELAPSCRLLASEDLQVCQDDPSQCPSSYSDEELAQYCANDSYSEDPLCKAWIAEQVAEGNTPDEGSDNDNTQTPNSVVDNGEGEEPGALSTSDEWSETVTIPPGMITTSVPDIAGPQGGELFNTMSLNIEDQCNQGLLEDCYAERYPAGN
jgi:hypothetical protein